MRMSCIGSLGLLSRMGLIWSVRGATWRCSDCLGRGPDVRVARPPVLGWGGREGGFSSGGGSGGWRRGGAADNGPAARRKRGRTPEGWSLELRQHPRRIRGDAAETGSAAERWGLGSAVAEASIAEQRLAGRAKRWVD